ncbi:signal transduction histidine kinase/CheY-like chemotaxis protein [Paucibacter oligotrophus]|uniref:histidine kinase n=1 Tax=Roseateles oligotrophus TaxID=1769250 RepID=A0A840L1Z2_9BURK|nr:ATP-binding protein [Roseateles oligotrophus]MBB4841841.1 signal transduction histidine kinase/CheY-like chemotaxis protein [Roseateles oligotrophus]
MPSPSIARRYALQVAGIALALLLVSGATEMYFSFQEARAEMARLQAAQAESAAREIRQFLQGIENGVDQVARLPWGTPGFGEAQKREEFHRLMSLFPAIMQMRDLGAQGQERLFASRSELDRLGHSPRGPASAAPALGYSPSYFGVGAEPMVDLSVAAGRGEASGVIRAAIHLRFLADGISRLRVGEGGRVYVLDAADRLIAHPQATQVLRQLKLSDEPVVQAARAAGGLAAMDATDFDGKPVIVTAVALRSPDWRVFVEQPRAEALQSAFATLRRTLLLFGLGGGLAALLAGLYARQLARPIVQLREAAGRIAQGDLSSRIAVKGEDELAQLAGDFNLMAGQLQASYAGLEAKVAERTEALSLARDEALQANAAKTRFLAAASHDLRQPMHTIGLLVGLLRERLRGRQAMELADKLNTSVALMEGLFGGLLDISKLDAGAVQVQPESFPLDGLLNHLEQTFAAQAEAQGLRLRVRRSGALVRSDPALLESVLANLLSNALRYTASGGVVLGCRRRGAQQLAVQVWDSGRGIPAHLRAAVFDEFYRIEASAAQAGQPPGLGLGLSIVKRSAALLDHRLSLRSWPGRGSMFEVLLPLATALPTLPSRLAQAQPVVEVAGGVEALQGVFVLIIEDDCDNRETLQSLCMQWGMLCVAANGAAEAERLLAGHLRAPELILSDFHLAATEQGDQAIARIRELTGERLPALILSAEVGDEVRARARACGAVLLTKPASAERLLEALLDLVKPQA